MNIDFPRTRLSNNSAMLKGVFIKITNGKDGKYYVVNRFKEPVEFGLWVDKDEIDFEGSGNYMRELKSAPASGKEGK